MEIAQGSTDAIRRRLIGEPVQYDPPVDAVRQTEQFLELLSLETLDLRTFEPRLVRLCHAVDHLNELHGDLGRTPSNQSDWQRPAAFKDAAHSLTAWLDAMKDPAATPDPAIVGAVENASKQLSAARRIERDRLLAEVALQRMPAETARSGLELLGWADGAVYHAWRLAELLRIAAGNQPAAS